MSLDPERVAEAEAEAEWAGVLENIHSYLPPEPDFAVPLVGAAAELRYASQATAAAGACREGPGEGLGEGPSFSESSREELALGTCSVRLARMHCQQSIGMLHQQSAAGARTLFCDICQRSFSDETNLKKHRMEKHYVCDVCDKRFQCKSHLTNHYRTHTGEKPFQCDICRKRFSLKPALMRHRRIHTRERPHRCNFCDERFPTWYSLNDHVRIHMGAKPYKCDDCSKHFSRKAHLLQHRLIHTGEMPYPCQYCRKTFRRLANLDSHIRRWHSGATGNSRDGLAARSAAAAPRPRSPAPRAPCAPRAAPCAPRAAPCAPRPEEPPDDGDSEWLEELLSAHAASQH